MLIVITKRTFSKITNYLIQTLILLGLKNYDKLMTNKTKQYTQQISNISDTPTTI